MILQIFPNGQLCLPSEGGAVLPGSQAWALQPVNAALIILEAPDFGEDSPNLSFDS